MKKKSLMLILLIFMISGCSVEVNVDISDNKIKESNDITVLENALYTKEILRTSFRDYIPIYASDLIVDTIPDQPFSDILYYNKKTTDLENGYKFNYSYDFDVDKYGDARTIKDGFRDYSYTYRNDVISLSTDDEGLIYFDEYPLLEEVTVNIKTDYLVEENNADKVNGNTYTWVFNKDSKKSIKIVVDTSESGNRVLGIINVSTVITIGIVIGIVLVILILLLIRNRKNNKI
ncbi:MAG TPA: hypothetical protein IAB38_04160 [Candidatus Onthousia excrementipullorum]|uniref:Lipoprotein n=1 Tax=Candidatus Onthousia excrementipullorum TaxID=2840884 RepID=A0A9D1DUU6_9FIRM|nr:hypothetical protein [Candidatus Onthousia excrementipullorum]